MNTKDGALDQRFVVPVRADLQISGWEGPEGIRATTRSAKTVGPHTPMLANPKNWTKRAQCVDDWKAFAPAGPESDEMREREPSREVAAALCGGCPVKGECLADAMAEEGTSQPAFRAGIRGGLTPSARHKLSRGTAIPEGTPCCPNSHPRAEFGHWDGARWRCDECVRVKNARMETCSCGKTMRRNTLYTHRRRNGCAKVSTPTN